VHDRRVQRFQSQVPKLTSKQLDWMINMVKTGATLTTLDELGAAQLKPNLLRLAAALKARPPAPGEAMASTNAELVEDLDVWRWGIRDDVLDMVEAYLERPVRYHGVEVRREQADNANRTVRSFHRDPEDHRMFKIIAYIEDVEPGDGGAFQWIPPEFTESTAKAIGYATGFRPETQLAAVVPRELWREAPGPAWTAVLTDGHRVFHRAGTPATKDRYSVTYSWMTRKPIIILPLAEPFTDAMIARLADGLNARQQASLQKIWR
jgi:hypothetical protein